MSHYEFEIQPKVLWHRPPETLKPRKPRAPAIRKTLVLAYQIDDHMKTYKIQTLKAFCQQANITSARASQIMNMLFLSPRIQEYILKSNSPKLYKLSEMTVRSLLKENVWTRQEELWGVLLELTRVTKG